MIEELPIDNIVVNNEGLQGTVGEPRGRRHNNTEYDIISYGTW